MVDYLNTGISDHCPLIVDTKVKGIVGRGSFKIFNYIASLLGYLELVQNEA